MTPYISKSPPPKIAAVNRFQGLDDQQEYDPAVLQQLSEWAHAVHSSPIQKVSQKARKEARRQEMSSAPTINSKDGIESVAQWIESRAKPAKEVIVVRTSADCKRLPHVVSALPEDPKALAKIMKKTNKIELQKGEMLVMVDSGSFVHAIDASVELPDHPIVNDPRDKNIIGETACGTKLVKEGTMHAHGTSDGVDFDVIFDHMKGIKTRIRSVRRLIIDNNEVVFNKKGGNIHNLSD